MTKICDLSWDLVEEILTRVRITSLGAVRSTCKRWNASSKDRILCKAKARQQFVGFMMKDSRVCSIRFDLHGFLNDDGHEEFVDPSIKKIGLLNHIVISEVFHCNGLLLCVIRDHVVYIPRLMVWNPYLGQTRWVQPRNKYHKFDRYALGYDNNKNPNHKILRYSRHFKGKDLTVECEVYDLKSNSWRVIDVTTDEDIMIRKQGASLKGNTYFFAIVDDIHSFFLCFDFTTERFGQFLHLPESHLGYDDFKTLSSLREEKLAALFNKEDTLQVDIWVTTKIEPNALSWSKFLKFDLEPFIGDSSFLEVASFFIEEDKKLAVVFDLGFTDGINKPDQYNTVYIIGENGCFKEVDLGVSWDMYFGSPVVCSSSYVPSLVQIT